MKFLNHSRFDSNTELAGILLFPIKALLAGNISLILYSLILGVPAWFFFSFVSQTALYLLSKGGITDKIVLETLFIVVPVLVWSVAFPVFLVAALLPIKFIWHEGKLSYRSLLKGTIPALRRACMATVFSLSGIFVIVGIVGGLYSFASSSLFQGLNLSYKEIVVWSITAVFLLATLKIALMLAILPFLTTSSSLSIKDSVSASFNLLENRKVTLGVIILFGVVSFPLVVPHSLLVSGTLKNLAFSQIAGAACAVWYFLACITVYCLAASETSASNQFKLLQSSATPIKIEKHSKEKANGKNREKNIAKKLDRMKRYRETTGMAPKDIELLFR